MRVNPFADLHTPENPEAMPQVLVYALPVVPSAVFSAPLDGGSSSGEWDSRYNFPGYLQPELGNVPGAGMAQAVETWHDRPMSGPGPGGTTVETSRLPGGKVANDATLFFGNIPGRTVSYLSPDDLPYPEPYQPPAAGANLPTVAVFSSFLRGV